MKKPKMTRAIAHAAATDAGNRHMRKHGRKVWNADDYMMAVAEYDRLYPPPDMVANLLRGL